MTSSTKARITKKNESQRRNPQAIVIGLSFGLIVAGVLIAVFLFQPPSIETAPNFTAQTVYGDTVSLDDYRGQLVMLNFWATWCPPCRAEMPLLQSAYEQLEGMGFTILAVNNSETLAQVTPFVESYGLTFPVLMDEQATVQRQFNITGYPTSMFLDPDGDVYAVHSGMINADQLSYYIQQGVQLMAENQ